jgi:hypothetical protein
MMLRVGIVLLACALSFSGDAQALTGHRNWSGPVYSCYWQGTIYRPGGYCVSNRGIVEVCTSSGDWMTLGPCLGDECRVACPG